MGYQYKICDLKEAKRRMAQLKDGGFQTVFTNGCFDILHKGHIAYLEKAGELGDFLIVGLNSDDSVSRLKGEGRPIKSIDSREAIMGALGCVNMVVVFEEDTPQKLIEQLKPDILVKGGDYKKENIVGADFVIKNGGEVKIIDFLDGYSSSSIIDKIQSD